MASELDFRDFFAQLDEISTDSASVDHFELKAQKCENKRLRQLLITTKDSTKEILALYRKEREITINLQQKLDRTLGDFNVLQRQYDEFERNSINSSFHQTQINNELQEKKIQEHEDYLELATNFFELLSEATCFHNYEVKKAQNRIVSKTERFLFESLGEKFKKPKIIRTKRGDSDDVKLNISRCSSRSSKREAKKQKNNIEPKRRKTDIWDMKSISQASSPAATVSFEDDTSDLSSEICEAESSFSFNTFSIGNETCFSFLQSQKNSPVRETPKCKCHLFIETDTVLVSVGTNTEDPEGPLPSLPVLKEAPSIITNDVGVDSRSDEKSVNPDQVVEKSSSDDITNLSSPEKAIGSKSLKYSTIATNTDQEEFSMQLKTTDQGTSPEPIHTSNKSTATVRSTTTRGTSTTSVTTKNCAVQFPEISFEKIFRETIFDLPDLISPISDDLESIQSIEKEMVATGTITEICNVNREVDYMSNSAVKVKNERSSAGQGSFVNIQNDAEEESFIILGQTLFNLFLKRMQKYNESLSDDDITRQKIWKHLKRQLLDRFSELPIDEMLSGSFSDCEIHEMISTDENHPCNGKERIAEFLEEHQSKNLDNTETESTCNEELAQFERDQHEQEWIEPLISNNVAGANIALSQCQSNLHTLQYQRSEVSKFLIDHPSQFTDTHTLDHNMFEEAIESFKSVCSSPLQLVEPIDDLSDVIWCSLFKRTSESGSEESPFEADDVLDGFDIENEPIEIPTEADIEVIENLQSVEFFTEYDSPKSPVHFTKTIKKRAPAPVIIPTEMPIKPGKTQKQSESSLISVLEYAPEIRAKLVQWNQRQKIQDKPLDTQLCKIRKSIKTYLESEWTDEILEACLKSINNQNQILIVQAIHETVEDGKNLTEINTEFTPPAPPLPRYLQKLILLIQKLSDGIPDLYHKLLVNLEEKLFRLENSTLSIDDLRNVTYYFTSLVDLFYNGNTTVIFYFLVKSIYFFGYKAIPMAFVLIKAFPLVLPKKSLLLKKYSKTVDWENMTGLELSKVHLDLDWMDSLDLTVIYLLTCIQQYRRKAHESNTIKDHELFNFLPKYYGYPLSFITAPKLLELLLKRLEEGKLENLSFSFIVFAKRTNPDFTARTILKGNLLPLLNKYVNELMENQKNQVKILQVSLLIESISTILKTFAEEKEKVATEIFPMFVSILGRVEILSIQEECIKGILRLQRFISNHKDIFSIIQHHEKIKSTMSESLQSAVQTFIHRKNPIFFAN